MRSPRHALVLCTLGACALWPATARPCSLIGPPEPPSLSGLEFFGTPILIGPPPTAEGGLPVLQRVGGSTLALDYSAAGNAVFAMLQSGPPRALYSIGSTLAPGAYTLGSDTFRVVDAPSASAIDVTAQPPVEGATLQLSIYEGSKCGGTALQLRLPAATTGHPRIYAIELTDGQGGRLAHLMATADAMAFVYGGGAIDLTTDRVCVKLKGLAWNGLQSEADLGCIDPADPADARVVRSDDPGGCSATGGSPIGLAPYALLLALATLLHTRRR